MSSAALRCDVLIIGGGPAGSTCAAKLCAAGADVIIVDRAAFPRDKPCAGWITPEVIDALHLDLAEYGNGRISQPIKGFQVGALGRGATLVRYDRTVSYAICRTEFDDYLLRRSQAPVMQGFTVGRIRHAPAGWVVNEAIETPLIVGAGGHFCPLARTLGFSPAGERAIVGRETEVHLTRQQADDCPVDPEIPQLLIFPDLLGYGWAMRKGDRLNVGYGRLDQKHILAHGDVFLAALDPVVADIARHGLWRGHAYLLRDASQRPLVGDGFLLTGDAAGLAYSSSGEGIRPAVISGILAAETIIAAGGDADQTRLAPYAAAIDRRFPRHDAGHWESWLPAPVLMSAVRRLMPVPSFARHLLNSAFLRTGMGRQPELAGRFV